MSIFSNYLRAENLGEVTRLGRRRMDDGGLVSTAKVPDGVHDYETLISSPRYHSDIDGLSDATVVEVYDSEEQARRGHALWLYLYEEDDLPDPLINRENSIDPFGCTTVPKTWRK